MNRLATASSAAGGAFPARWVSPRRTPRRPSRRRWTRQPRPFSWCGVGPRPMAVYIPYAPRCESLLPGDAPSHKRQGQSIMKDENTVKYIYSACIVTATPDLRIVHDPWFTEGVYDGSWFHFPAVRDPIESIGNVDLVYVSHIHPDHYDPRFLRKYFSTFGEKRIII